MSAPRVVSFGCRLNAWEAEAMKAQAAAAGLNETIIVNTCAVTAEAVRQAAQQIRRLRRDDPGARVVVTGCGAQIDPGVPWTLAEGDGAPAISLALKSGNFGTEDFFTKALAMLPA